MRFMMIVKASERSEAGEMPSEQLISEMNQYNEQLSKAGILLDMDGLQPSSKGARVKFSGGKVTVVDGPFAEAKELIAGFWLIDVKSKEEAVEWARRAPNPQGPGYDGEIEVRQVFELDDFEPSAAVEKARELGQKLKQS